MHWNMAAPSMLTVAPMGRMKRLMRLSTPLFSSTHFIIEGRVAELVRRRNRRNRQHGSIKYNESTANDSWMTLKGLYGPFLGYTIPHCINLNHKAGVGYLFWKLFCFIFVKNVMTPQQHQKIICSDIFFIFLSSSCICWWPLNLSMCVHSVYMTAETSEYKQQPRSKSRSRSILSFWLWLYTRSMVCEGFPLKSLIISYVWDTLMSD